MILVGTVSLKEAYGESVEMAIKQFTVSVDTELEDDEVLEALQKLIWEGQGSLKQQRMKRLLAISVGNENYLPQESKNALLLEKINFGKFR